MDDRIPDAYAAHSISILRIAAGHRAKAMEALLELESSMIGRIATAPTINSRARAEKILEQTEATITQAYDAIAENHGTDLAALASIEQAATVGIISSVIGADINSVAFSASQLEAIVAGDTLLGHSSGKWWKAQDVDLQTKFRGVMQNGLLTGQTNEELIRKVRGTAAGNFNDGIMAAKRRDAAAIVRSSAISTANTARMKTIERMPDITKGIQWLATLDGKTTLICIALSGEAWTLPDYTPIGHDKAYPGPTAHWNCRSVQIPVLKSWEEMSGKKLPSIDNKKLEERVKQKLAAKGMSAEQISKATINSRASMDGQVSKDLKFEDWMKRKDDTVINGLLGPGRAKLRNRGNGKLTVSDLTDQSNRPLTIAQLKANLDTGAPLPETQGIPYREMDKDGQYLPATKKKK